MRGSFKVNTRVDILGKNVTLIQGQDKLHEFECRTGSYVKTATQLPSVTLRSYLTYN